MRKERAQMSNKALLTGLLLCSVSFSPLSGIVGGLGPSGFGLHMGLLLSTLWAYDFYY